MAIVTYNYNELCGFAGKKIGAKELCSKLDLIGAHTESFEKDEVSCDITPNRIDLLSVEGMGRALANFIGTKDPCTYKVHESDAVFNVDPSVNDVRPYVVGGIVKGVRIDDSTIKSLMQVQEKIHTTHGRHRKKVAIGIHNLDTIKPPFTYKAVHPNEISFVPLDMDESLNLDQVLERHPKGKEYAHLVNEHKKYPIIVDSQNNVLSFPPIINGELTRVSDSTTNIFIDITGTSFEAVNSALCILSSLFADRGGKLYSVKMGNKRLPDMSRKTMEVSVEQINDLIGFKLNSTDVIKLLKMMGHIAKGKDKLKVDVPPYRADMLHWVDISEDVAIAYGYNKLKPTLPDLSTIGQLIGKKEDSLVEVLVGLGFNEMVTYTLSNSELNYAKMRIGDDKKASIIMNPLTVDFTLFRTWLLPSLLNVLSLNSHEAMPQKIFEIGECIDGGNKHIHIACAIEKAKATFSDIKSITDALVFELGSDYTFREEEHPSFIPGRCLAIYSGKARKGFLGEIHPEVMNNFNIEEPVVALDFRI